MRARVLLGFPERHDGFLEEDVRVDMVVAKNVHRGSYVLDSPLVEPLFAA